MPDAAADNLATVTLDVDTAPWESGLKKADGAAAAWADRAASQFERVTAAADKTAAPDLAGRAAARLPEVRPPKLPAADDAAFAKGLDAATGKAASWSDRVKALLGKAAGTAAGVLSAETAAGKVGAGVGGVLGGVIGGGLGPAGSLAGAAIGSLLGKSIGDHLDLSAAVEKLSKISPAVKSLVEDAGDAWEGFQYAVEHRLDELKGRLGDIDIGLVLADPDPSALDLDRTMRRVHDEVGATLYDISAQGTARVADLVDNAVGAIQKPAAAAAEVTQLLLEKFGLVEKSTDRWGQTIAGIDKPFETAAGKIALGLGYVNDALAKFGATINKYVTAPLLDAVAAIGRMGAAVERAAARVTPKALGGGEGGSLEQMADRAERGAAVVEAAAARLRATAQEQLDRELGSTGRRWEQQLRGFLGNFLARGRELNAADDKARAPVQSAGDAALRGSREAANAVIAASFRGGPGAPAERAAKAAERVAGLTQESRDILSRIEGRLNQPPVVEAA